MPLKYNRETAVDRDIKTQNETDYTFLQSNQLEQQSQNDKFVFASDLLETQTLTYTLTQDIILTSIQLSVRHNVGGGEEEIHAYIDNELILHLHVDTSAAQNAYDSVTLPIPNWKLFAGQVLTLETTEAGAGSCSGSGAFIGYYI